MWYKNVCTYFDNGRIKTEDIYRESGLRKIEYYPSGKVDRVRDYYISEEDGCMYLSSDCYNWENGNFKEERHYTAENEVVRQYGEDGTKLSEMRIFYDDFSNSDR